MPPSKPTRHLAITSADGQSGHLIAELILISPEFSNKLASLTLLAFDPSKCADLEEEQEEGGPKLTIVKHTPGSGKTLVKTLKDASIDTIMLIPPAHKDKLEVTTEMIEATKEAGVKNVVLLSSAGADLAEREKQPRLREFIDIEQMVLEAKGLTSTEAAHSPCVIRAGFYAENLLLYNKAAQASGKLPIPIGKNHKFAPVALGDIAQIAAHVLTDESEQGLGDKHRGQLIVMTGPLLTAGEELAMAASEALGVKLEFEDISTEEAAALLDAETDIDDSEKEYLLEYYSLVREGKTNYISTIAFNALTGGHPMQPADFFKVYSAEFKPKRRRTK